MFNTLQKSIDTISKSYLVVENCQTANHLKN